MSTGSPYAHLDEDRIDRWFNRKLAFPIAVVCARLGVHPNTVSLVGMGLGVASGWWFQYQDATVVWGIGLLFVATIIDNADGMVARMTGKSSQFGYVLDGVCDNFVFISIYLGGIVSIWDDPTPFGGEWGPWAWVLALVAGASHSRQSAMLDFYKGQWRYWACLRDDSRFKTPDEVRAQRAEASGLTRTFLGIHVVHARQQETIGRARLALMPRMQELRSEPGFPDRYVALNRLPMKGWFIMGPNWHIITVGICGWFGRMDLYFWAQILPFNALLLATIMLQASRDRRLVG